mmetsp:Transcript_8936/g.36894  ORF Transcript_8936/g.36894 Transcript_8936/m.36894 type:complete len:206 (+) Transcript_8936:67-684(+)
MSSEETPLPKGWSQKTTKEGKVYYVDHNTKTTHWTRPEPEAEPELEPEEAEPEEEPVDPSAEDRVVVFSSGGGGIKLGRKGDLWTTVDRAAKKAAAHLNAKNIKTSAVEAISASLNQWECNVALVLRDDSVVDESEEGGEWKWKVFGDGSGYIQLVKKVSLAPKARSSLKKYITWRATAFPADGFVQVGTCSNEFHVYTVAFYKE